MNPELEQQIARQVQKGDPQGITRLLESFGGKVSGYLQRRFPSFDDHDVQDVLVDAVLKIGHTYDPEKGKLGAWLLFLAHQQAVAVLRDRHRGQATELLDPELSAASEPSPLARLVGSEEVERIRQAFEGLAPLERAVIEADVLAEQTVNARLLAERLGTTTDSIYVARARARSKLKRSLGMEPGTDELPRGDK